MTSLSLATTSRVWSCNTLSDGMDRLLAEANAVEQEEEQLEQVLQDRQHMLIPTYALGYQHHCKA